MSGEHSPFAAQPYAGLITFGRQPARRECAGADIAIVGIPYDGSVSYRSGTRFGPRAIREQSQLLWGYNNALQVHPFQTQTVVDYGDVDIVPVDIQATHRAIETEVGEIIAAGSKVISLGGDHSVTLPLLRAHAKKFGPPAVVHFDAHPDTWDCEYAGQRYSHGTGFRRAIEEGLIDTAAYLQIGIRGPTAGPEDYQDAAKLGATMFTTDTVASRGVPNIVQEIRQRVGQRPVYVSLDIDAVDPAFAPGTGTPEVGGLTSREILALVRGLEGLNLLGGDLVEVSPSYDASGITAILAANLVFEMLSLMAKT
ncbi:MAG: agmatinase [Planctomycetaceae bacterium]